RKDHVDGTCLFCGERIKHNEQPAAIASPGEDPVCRCKPIDECVECLDCRAMRKKKSRFGVPHPYTCKTHGLFQQYQDNLKNYKNWCILWVTLFTIPLVLLANAAGLNLGWVYLFTGVLIGSSVIPISLSVLWDRVTAQGMISGAVLGCIAGIVSWLATASTYPGGLYDFLKNTYQDVAMLVGNCVAIGVGGIVCVFVSLCTIDRKKHKKHNEWEKTRNIENPLHPWAKKYETDFGNRNSNKRPTQLDMERIFKKARLTAIIFGIIMSVGLIIIWPAVMTGLKVLKEDQFYHWTVFSQIWAFIAAAFIISVPLIQEIYGIYKQTKKNRMYAKMVESQRSLA
ncbi:unnamed protein product, partial [Owenia fusiformis]